MARKPRTSADLPSTPADPQQRQGRAVRERNTLSTVQVFYYFAARPSRQGVESVAGPADTAEEILP